MPDLRIGLPRLTLVLFIWIALCFVGAQWVMSSSEAATIGDKNVNWGWGKGEGPAGDYDFPSENCEGNHTDPVGVLFVGKRAGVSNVEEHIEIHNRWYKDTGVTDPLTGNKHSLLVRNDAGELKCKTLTTANASADDASDRLHVRLWGIPGSKYPEVMTVGTPHHEDFIPFSCGSSEPPFFEPNHAVDPNGSVGAEHGPNASGFDWARHNLKFYFSHPDSWGPPSTDPNFPDHYYGGNHKVQDEYWGNSANFSQCTGEKAGSDGWGVVIWINRETDPRVLKTVASQSGAKFIAAFHGNGTTNEWWFGYGTKSAEGETGYQHQSAVKSSSAEGEIGVSLPVGGLSPRTKYFARLFVRTEDGDIEEGEEVTFTTQAPPVAAYSFDAGSGETAEDVTGNEHNGAIEGATWTEHGRFGSALAFAGEGEDCVVVPESKELELTEELTLEAWVKPSGPTEDDPIIFKESLGVGGVPAYAMGIGVTAEGKPEGIIGDEAITENVEAPKAIESNVWTHLAFTYDGAYMRLYVNGALVATAKEERSPPEAPGYLRIGCSAPWWEEGFDGRIDEVRIYDRALSAGEIGADSVTPAAA